ncbi:nuclear transport factor 2 family protein [Streptomyces sp. NPDC051366]|uniref:nuclear transport factor 2 family protein n=1 Tax=Streptomyces sp. NPDC051366 TaxID=3365652 RepID=UPI0037A84473
MPTFRDDVAYTIGAYQLAFTGRNAFVSHIREYAAAVPDRKLTLKRIIADGDLIAFETDFARTSSGAVPALPPAREPVTAAFCTVLQLREGKISSQDDTPDSGGLRTAVAGGGVAADGGQSAPDRHAQASTTTPASAHSPRPAAPYPAQSAPQPHAARTTPVGVPPHTRRCLPVITTPPRPSRTRPGPASPGTGLYPALSPAPTPRHLPRPGRNRSGQRGGQGLVGGEAPAADVLRGPGPLARSRLRTGGPGDRRPAVRPRPSTASGPPTAAGSRRSAAGPRPARRARP